jgi:dephospho-CoA kinase
VDRRALKAAIFADPGLLARVEAAVHPLVAADRAAFLEAARAEGRTVAVCDVPLLYETGAQGEFDVVAVVSAPPEVQRQRVLERPGMTPEAFAAILAWQMPDADKRARADVVIDTSRGPDAARAQIRSFMERLMER